VDNYDARPDDLHSRLDKPMKTTTTLPRCESALACTLEAKLRDTFRLAAERLPLPLLSTLAGVKVAGPASPPTTTDRRGEIARLADRSGRRLDGIPCGLRSQLRLPRCSWLFRKGGLVIAVGSLARIECYADSGYDERPLDAIEIEQALTHWGLRSDLPTLIGLLSPTGFANDVSAAALARPDRHVALIAPVALHDQLSGEDRFACQVTLSPKIHPELGELFDPEPPSAKLERARRYLEHRPELGSPGGLLLLDGLAEQLGVPTALFAAAVGTLASDANRDLIAEVIEGEWVLRRPRRR
jgi:hypothetical protein